MAYKNKEDKSAHCKQWCLDNPEKVIGYQKKYQQSRKGKEKNSRQYLKNKLLVITHYSQGIMKCINCGEDDYHVLTIDHINNDGKMDRKENGCGGQFYRYLIKNNFPIGLQVLCANCNLSKSKRNIIYRKNKYNNKE